MIRTDPTIIDVEAKDVTPKYLRTYRKYEDGLKAIAATLLGVLLLGGMCAQEAKSDHARRVKQCLASAKYTVVVGFWDDDTGCMWKYPDGSIKRATITIY